MDKISKYIDKYKIENIQGILLDFDGTIVPSEKVFLDTWKDVFMNKYQCVFTNEEYIKYELEKDTKLIDYLLDCNRLDRNWTKQELMQSVYMDYAVNFQKMLEETDFTNTLDYIAKWEDAGIRLSIVSTSNRNYIEMFFNRYKIYREMFSYIFCREDVEKLKPDPMVYLLAARKLEIENSKCLVVEDSLKGLKGAIAAEMQVVRVLENTFIIKDFPLKNVSTVNSIKDIIL